MSRIYVVGQFVLFAVLAVSLILFPTGQTPLLRVIGLALVAAAFVVLVLAVGEFRARNALLPNIAPTPNRQAALVESGIYHYVRHPIYTSVLAGAIGVALMHGHIAVLIVALIIVAFFTAKSLYEERLLRAAYPRYADYMTHTGRFLPYL